jgi:hypothetical protein
MGGNNIWLDYGLVKKSAKKIAVNFYTKANRKAVYNACLAMGPEIANSHDSSVHGHKWPWVFLNMLSRVHPQLCATMILTLTADDLPWKKTLAIDCLKASERIRELKKSI